MKNLLTLLFMLAFGSTTIYCQLNWEHTGGPNGGVVSRLYYNDQYAFFPDEFHLYRSHDGTNWEALGEGGLWPMDVQGSTIVGQKWTQNSFYDLGARKFKISHDNGNTWIENNMPQGIPYFSDIALCSHGIYIPIGQDGILLRSHDEGITWDTIAAPEMYAYDVWSFEDRLYMQGSSNSLWRTDTDGGNWEHLTPPTAPTEYISNFFVTGSNIIIGTEGKVWHSHDDGQTWSSFDSQWPDYYSEFAKVGNIIYALGGSVGLSMSTDFGQNWTEIDYGAYGYSIYAIAAAGNTLIGGSTGQGIFRWDIPTQSFIESNLGIGSASIFDLAAKDDKVWAATGSGVFKFDETQGTWNDYSFLPRPDRRYYQAIAVGDNGLVCANSWLSDTMYISTDYGTNWNTINFQDIGGNFGYFGKIFIEGNVIFIATEFDGDWRSADFGQTWQLLDVPTSLDYNNLAKLNNKLWVIGYPNIIYTSDDLGASWVQSSTFPYGDIAWIESAGNRLFVLASVEVAGQYQVKMYMSTDGVNWNYAGEGIPNNFIGWDPSDARRMYMEYQGKYFMNQGYYGMFSSNDNCNTWFPVDRHVFQAIIQKDSLFYAGSYGGGVVKTPIPTNLYGELIQGTVFKDDSNNGLQDNNEPAIPNINVSIDQVGAWFPFYFSSTDADGQYSLGITPNQQDTLRPWINSNIVENINPPFYIANSGGTKNFGLHLTQGIHDVSATGFQCMRPRPGFDYWSYVRIDNLGSENEPTTTSLKLDDDLTYLSASPAPTAIIGDSLIWDLSDIPVFNGNYIVVKTNVPATTPLGNWVINTWRATTTNNDHDLSNNVYVTLDTVVGSYDPNEKIVEPAEGLSEAEIAAGKELLYTIRFQNTGTFPAERVRITDLLDTALYMPSVRLVAASHPVTSFSLKPGGLLEVLFDNIQLPDSTNNEPASHGFVTFAVQRNKAYNKDYPVRNTASIYFDFNEPIFTNEVSFTVNPDNVSSTHEARPKGQAEELLIFPNPTAGSFTVNSKGKLSGHGKLLLVNSMGQTILEQNIGNLSNPIHVKTNDLLGGLYFVKISGGKGFMSGKVVVQRGH